MPNIIASILFALLYLNGCGGTSNSLKNRKESADTQLQLGIRYLGMDKLQYAREHLHNALSLDKNNVEVHNALGFLHEKLNQPDDALSYYQTALEIEPDNLSALNNLGRFLCDRQQTQQGLGYLDRSFNSPLNNRLWITSTNIGYCHLEAGDLSQAQAYFKQTLTLRPNYVPALLAMQRISYELKDYWAAKGFLERYLTIGKHNPQTLWYAYQCERALGNAKAAHDLRIKLINQFPLSTEAQKLATIHSSQ